MSECYLLDILLPQPWEQQTCEGKPLCVSSQNSTSVACNATVCSMVVGTPNNIEDSDEETYCPV